MDQEYYHELRLCDTANLGPQGYPKEVAVAGIELRVPRAHALTSASAFQAAVVRVLEPEERRAVLDGLRYFNYERCCALCGHALDLTRCSGCGREFRDDAIACTSGIDLPPLVRQWFEAHGRVFEQVQ